MNRARSWRYALLPAILFFASALFAQNAPYWVTHLTVKNPGKYYFGIGSSTESQKAADDDARGEFSKNVSVKVQSVTDSYLSESGGDITDSFKQQLKVESGLDLRGISISDRYYDPETKTYYSLIKYEKDKYIQLFKEELKREVERIRQENLIKEQKEKEKIRHEREMARIEAEKERKQMELQRERERLEQEKERARQQHIAYIMRTRGNFIRMASPHRAITLPTAEIGNKFQEITITPSLKPFGFQRFDYSFYWKIVSFSFNLSRREKFFDWQEFMIKLHLLNGQIDVFKTGLALGAVEYGHQMEDLKKVTHENIGYSLFLVGNISIPQIYTHSSLYLDRRKLALSFQYFPFFDDLRGKLSLVVQNEWIFDRDFRNRFDDRLLIQPGIRFVIVPELFTTTLSYRLNEYFVWEFTLRI